MDINHNPAPRSNAPYESRIADEEAKLRWLIARHPGIRELSYYLIFLLAAHERYAKALEECRRVLESHPGDVVARMWRELIRLRWLHFPHRRGSRPQANREQRWRHTPRHTS
ncbi:MAG TPA: hypothetical protein VLE03_02620 [Nitrospiraceae bacterium]|nr:hypothetical protein [Nitrospiraceae bacterium]